MRGKRTIDLLVFICSAIVCAMSFFYLDGYLRWVSCVASSILTVFFLILALDKRYLMQQETKPGKSTLLTENITELVLLNEEDEMIAAWEMYGKTSMVIGRDIGENQVNVNLNEVAFASMIDREHAVLNYSGGQWYVEDLNSKNGISVIKPDGRKYRLSPDKPCLLGVGDILHFAMTKLLLR